MDGFFHPEAKKLVKNAVAAVEKRTSAEVVVAVHKVAGDYPHVGMVGGLVLALAWLCVFLYFPEPFEYTYLPVEELGAFAIGWLITSALDPLKRVLAGARRKQQAVRSAAREAFVDMGIGKTKGRTGILVYVAAFERRAEVVCDVGVDVKLVGAPLLDAIKKIERSVRLDRDPERFAEALESLGPALEKSLPALADDVNELSDEQTTKEDESYEDGPDSDDTRAAKLRDEEDA
jgi:putative membrane protein